ncbi:DUF3750 domain-containing protein [Jannaschia sp. W003]|uniref:DUF3750 domain-containing protein n=1 Tax=Jannaschia sp. W003 TaxID=2867012 RepID=UPI0021A77BDE|nr:DUF3750 domain-containing protein [Jannaschia sp. W003]UWQ22308.1 DUF3750 domain-containing protein [Jannaschia sp. W003]
MLFLLLRAALLFVALFVVPVLASLVWWANVDRPRLWNAADWSSAAILPPAAAVPEARVHVLAARTGGLKGAVSVHSWIVWKREGAARWTRHDVVGWGRPLRRDAYAADGRWYSNEPSVLATATGARAAAMIPKLEAEVAAYPFAARGDYRIFPGPNSNTFVAHLLRRVPELGATLPPIAAGKDWLGPGIQMLRDAGGDLHLSFGGWAGASAGPRTGIELHLLGQTLGVDLRRPALKLPGVGRVGMAEVPRIDAAAPVAAAPADAANGIAPPPQGS